MIQTNGRSSRSEKVRLELEAFAENASSHLRSIKGKLGQKTFRFMPAEGIEIPKLDAHGKKTGKFRPIVLAPVESRIVQRAILNVLLDVPQLQPYIKTRYSFGGIRGESGAEGGTEDRSKSLSAVPAAIQAILEEIGNGARFVACADIRSFFTRISKPIVTQIVSDAVKDEEFIALFREAITVELSNMAQLKGNAKAFPIEEIGVAQGSSLSPLLGNIILANFDKIMNEGDCKCIRYIDDFIILAPSKAAAGARLRMAKKILSELGMELSPEKSSKGGVSIDEGFDFLGINICPGAIRPSKKAQNNILNSIKLIFGDSLKEMRGVQSGQPFKKVFSLAGTLKRVDGVIDGWRKHYWFCNDKQIFENVDDRIAIQLQKYLGEYKIIRNKIPREKHQCILGVSETKDFSREPFAYPKLVGVTRNK